VNHLLDALGKLHQPAPQLSEVRIVSLVPSLTELICDLGLASLLVGRTGFCIHPAEALATIPKLGGTKDVQLEKLRALQPTHVLVNMDENTKPTVDALAAFVPHMIVTHPITVEDNLHLYRLLGGIFHADAAAEDLCQKLKHELSLTQALDNKRVLYCIWQDPWMTVARDTYIAHMLGLIGWQQWQAPNTRRYPEFAWTEALLSEVDEVLLSSEPYRFTQVHVDALEKQLGLPVRLVDGEMLSWYGSRAITGLAYLRELAGT